MSQSPVLSQPMLPDAVTGEPIFTQLAWRTLLALALLLVVSALGLLLVLARQSPDAVAAAWSFVDMGWLLIGLGGAVSGGLAAGLARRAADARQNFMASACIALALMAGCATLAVSVIEAIGLWRYPAAMNQPHLIRIAPPAASAPPGTVPAAAAAEPSAERGATWYASSCTACHGGAGEGVEGIAPALAATDWLAARSDGEVVAFLKVGRMPDDPQSKMGRAMPARGGNMALTDSGLADIVAFLRTLTATDKSDATGSVAATLPRWLLAPPSPPPGTDLPLVAAQRQPRWPHDIAGLVRQSFDPLDRDLATQCLAATTALRLGLVIALLLLMVTWLGRSDRLTTDRSAAAPRNLTAGWLLLIVISAAVITARTLLA
ncbi:MAG: cytochrome c [Phycisphaeraceae bacterium]